MFTCVQSCLVVVIAATQEKVTHHRAYEMASQRIRRSARGMLNVANMIVHARHNVAGRDEHCVQIDSLGQVGVYDFVVDG